MIYYYKNPDIPYMKNFANPNLFPSLKMKLLQSADMLYLVNGVLNGVTQ